MKRKSIIFIAIICLFATGCSSTKVNSISTVKEFFVKKNYKYPLHFKKDYEYRILSMMDGECQITEEEKKQIVDFYDYLVKNIQIEHCKKWASDADAFVISNPFIFVDGEIKHLGVVVSAYFENKQPYDRTVRIENTDICINQNFLLFDFNTYEELGWVL